MGSAYTPGLTVSKDVVVRRTRRLPIKGDVLVSPKQGVKHDTVVARALLPGPLQTIKLAEKLGIEAKDIVSVCQIKVGDTVAKGQIIAATKGWLIFKGQEVQSDYEGTVESVSEVSGSVLVREASVPVEINGYMDGVISDVIPNEGAIVETRGAMVQGIFGVGGERNGSIRVAVSGPSDVLGAENIQDSDRGKILVGGSGVTLEALQKANTSGVIGIVVGAVKDVDLTKFLGFDIGVAITGQEPINITLIATEGFGNLNMADRTFELLKTLEGRQASINGATQIRAGVVRPEVIAPDTSLEGSAHVASSGGALEVGTSIRVIREPYFGLLGTVTGLPAQLVTVDSGAEVRVLNAKLADGRDVTVPRANVEIIVAS
ncbi:MAG: hypothetical protein JNM34_02510 [Chthonomonadaceae bacterium]|nr:hypothetical protein [Chthonomonadaceae bacterium]